MIIDCAHYRDGRRQSDAPMTLDEAARTCREEGFVWLGLFEPGAEELDEVRRALRAARAGGRGRADASTCGQDRAVRRRRVRLVILRTARYDDEREEVDFGEISVFLAADFVITVRQGVASELRDGPAAAGAAGPSCCDAGSASALWAILDQVVDGYAPVVAELERDIEQVEAHRVLRRGGADRADLLRCAARPPTSTARCTRCWPWSPRVERTAPRRRAAPYLRDVHDHLLLVNEEVAAQRDLLATVLEANMAVISVEQTEVSVRQNATIEQLTMLATVFLPLTFITGFFGQNFGWLVGHIERLHRVPRLRHRRPGRAAGPAVPLAALHPAPTGARRRRSVTRTRTRPADAVADRQLPTRSGSPATAPPAVPKTRTSHVRHRRVAASLRRGRG